MEKQKKEDEERALAAQLKQEREVQKKALKKERKLLRTLLKENQYFTDDDGIRLQRMSELDFIIEEFTIEQ